MNGLLLSSDAFKSLSANTQQEVLASIGLGDISGVSPTSKDGGQGTAQIVQSQDGDGPVELTVAMVRKLTANLSDKTLTALKIIAQSSTPQFHMADVIAGTDGAVDYMDMRGVWSALTRRTRKITGDASADLIWWIGEPIDDADEKYVDHIGSLSPLTHQSLRTHFGF